MILVISLIDGLLNFILVKDLLEFWYLLVLCSFCLPDTDFIISQVVFILLLELII